MELASDVAAAALVALCGYGLGWLIAHYMGELWDAVRELRQRQSAADRADDRAENELRRDLAEAIRTQDELARARTSTLRSTKHGASRLRKAIVAHEAAMFRLGVRS